MLVALHSDDELPEWLTRSDDLTAVARYDHRVFRIVIGNVGTFYSLKVPAVDALVAELEKAKERASS